MSDTVAVRVGGGRYPPAKLDIKRGGSRLPDTADIMLHGETPHSQPGAPIRVVVDEVDLTHSVGLWPLYGHLSDDGGGGLDAGGTAGFGEDGYVLVGGVGRRVLTLPSNTYNQPWELTFQVRLAGDAVILDGLFGGRVFIQDDVLTADINGIHTVIRDVDFGAAYQHVSVGQPDSNTLVVRAGTHTRTIQVAGWLGRFGFAIGAGPVGGSPATTMGVRAARLAIGGVWSDGDHRIMAAAPPARYFTRFAGYVYDSILAGSHTRLYCVGLGVMLQHADLGVLSAFAGRNMISDVITHVARVGLSSTRVLNLGVTDMVVPDVPAITGTYASDWMEYLCAEMSCMYHVDAERRIVLTPTKTEPDWVVVDGRRSNVATITRAGYASPTDVLVEGARVAGLVVGVDVVPIADLRGDPLVVWFAGRTTISGRPTFAAKPPSGPTVPLNVVGDADGAYTITPAAIEAALGVGWRDNYQSIQVTYNHVSDGSDRLAARRHVPGGAGVRTVRVVDNTLTTQQMVEAFAERYVMLRGNPDPRVTVHLRDVGTQYRDGDMVRVISKLHALDAVLPIRAIELSYQVGNTTLYLGDYPRSQDDDRNYMMRAIRQTDSITTPAGYGVPATGTPIRVADFATMDDSMELVAGNIRVADQASIDDSLGRQATNIRVVDSATIADRFPPPTFTSPPMRLSDSATMTDSMVTARRTTTIQAAGAVEDTTTTDRSVIVVVSFNEPPVGFGPTDITVTNGAVSQFLAANQERTQYAMVVTATAAGLVTVAIAQTSGWTADSLSWTYRAPPPAPPAPVVGGEIRVTSDAVLAELYEPDALGPGPAIRVVSDADLDETTSTTPLGPGPAIRVVSDADLDETTSTTPLGPGPAIRVVSDADLDETTSTTPLGPGPAIRVVSDADLDETTSTTPLGPGPAIRVVSDADLDEDFGTGDPPE